MFRELLQQRLAGIADLSTGQLLALEAHYELLRRWNRVLNLTSIEGVTEVVERHYCESVFLAVHLPRGAFRIADVGSGAGFPGIPVAIFRPDVQVRLIESHRRKAVFLREASRTMKNIEVSALRAEDLKERFDRVISRAVSYEQLTPVLKSLAEAADLLTGAELPPKEIEFSWLEPLRLPWGKNRFLRSGRLT